MSTAVSECTCSVWEPSAKYVRRCDPCHKYYRGTKELASVSAVLRACWPVKPEPMNERAQAAYDNANLRGVEVDALFSRWLRGDLSKIPAGTREDSKALFVKLTDWWRTLNSSAETQVILADDDVAGTSDIVTIDDWIWDVKCVYDLQIIYDLQLGFYANLFEAQYGRPPKGIGIVHVAERFDKPKTIPLDLKGCRHDAQQIQDVWVMAKRRLKKSF